MRKETSSRKSSRKSGGSSAAKPRRRTEASLRRRLLDSMKIRSLQDWEQGRRRPDIPIRAYLAVIQRDPQAVIRALRAA